MNYNLKRKEYFKEYWKKNNMTFNDWWKENSKRVHSENPWREELAREIWEAAVAEFSTVLYTRLTQVNIYPKKVEPSPLNCQELIDLEIIKKEELE